jgi:hypothetical protein
MRRVLAVLGLALAMVLSLALPASAKQPTITRFHDEGSGVPVEDCGSFVVLLTFSHDETITTFYDNTGTPIRAQIRFSFSSTLTNSVTGKTAFETGDYTIIADLIGGDAKVVGLVLLIYLPGVGVVTLELGQVTFDHGSIWVTSEPEILNGDSLFCSILA